VVKSDIEEVLRLKTKSKPGPAPNTIDGQTSQRSETPPILVKFLAESTKNALFDGYLELVRIKKFLKCSAIGLQYERRIYVNHHLSPMLRKIQDRAILLQKANIFEKVNARNNAISVKIGGKWTLITTEAQLEKLIKNQPETGNHVSSLIQKVSQII